MFTADTARRLASQASIAFLQTSSVEILGKFLATNSEGNRGYVVGAPVTNVSLIDIIVILQSC